MTYSHQECYTIYKPFSEICTLKEKMHKKQQPQNNKYNIFLRQHHTPKTLHGYVNSGVLNLDSMLASFPFHKIHPVSHRMSGFLWALIWISFTQHPSSFTQNEWDFVGIDTNLISHNIHPFLGRKSLEFQWGLSQISFNITLPSCTHTVW